MIRRLARLALLTASSIAILSAGVIAVQPQNAAAGSASDGASAQVSTGPFTGLQVGVSQTRNLTNQVVKITWSGATPTQPLAGTPVNNYLQIMQCWGDNPSGTTDSVTPGLEAPGSSALGYGPTPQNCQYGGTGTREIDPGSIIDPLNTVDPNVECYDLDLDPNTPDTCNKIFMPFASVTGSDPIIDPLNNVYFDANTTNEITAARTRSDGTGIAYFEMQTLRQAPGLGCGAAEDSGSAIIGRACWLVIVPRDNHEVNGNLVGSGQNIQSLVSSPLSATNWANRVVIPLSFAPIGNVCPIGGHERRVLGSQGATDAVTRWQAPLCASGERIFSFDQVAEPVAVNQLNSTDAGLALVDHQLSGVNGASVYAPILVGGVTFASLIERQVRGSEDQSMLDKDGERMPALNLNARLVAKLLTQSYLNAIAGSNDSSKTSYMYKANPDLTPMIANDELQLAPRTLMQDPEFVALNPAYADFAPGYFIVNDIVVPTGSSAVYQLVWKWILSDPDAKGFLDGVPDEWGMKVNPYYVGAEVDANGDPINYFPKLDQTCGDPIPGFSDDSRICTNNANAYVADMESGARLAGRGDDGAITTWDATATPPRFKSNGPAAIGKRGVLVLTTSALADRYGLSEAALENSTGDLNAPTSDSITEALSQMPTSAPRAKAAVAPEPDPATASGDAYPLATITYATTVPARLTVEAATDYEAFIKFAVLNGQQPGVADGRLPYGYVTEPPGRRRSERNSRWCQSRSYAFAYAHTYPYPDTDADTYTDADAGAHSVGRRIADFWVGQR